MLLHTGSQNLITTNWQGLPQNPTLFPLQFLSPPQFLCPLQKLLLRGQQLISRLTNELLRGQCDVLKSTANVRGKSTNSRQRRSKHSSHSNLGETHRQQLHCKKNALCCTSHLGPARKRSLSLIRASALGFELLFQRRERLYTINFLYTQVVERGNFMYGGLEKIPVFPLKQTSGCKIDNGRWLLQVIWDQPTRLIYS